MASKTAKKRYTRPATPRQSQILTFVRRYVRENGYSPTLQEIGDHLDISKVTVFEHLTTLEERGLISRDRHKARSLNLSDHLQLPDDRPTLLPLAGRIAAGRPIDAVQRSESLDLERLFGSRGKSFALEVRGDSMIDDQICDGDYVICESRSRVRDGETVVALLDNGEATLKRYYKEKDRIRLQPANSNYKPLYVQNVQIQGVVIGVIRKY